MPKYTHCWSCKHPIDTKNLRCPICKWIICPTCGSCKQFGCISYRNLTDDLPQQVSLRKYIRNEWNLTPKALRPGNSEIISWTEKIIEDKRKADPRAIEKMKTSACFLEFLRTKPKVKNKRSSATGIIIETSAPKDYKWFYITVKYANSTEKKYAPFSIGEFCERFEIVTEEKELNN